MKVEVGRKDRLPLLLATISVGIKTNCFSFTETWWCCCCGRLPHRAFAAVEPLSDQKELS